MAITVTLPDGKPLQLPDGATGADAAAAIGPGLARAALAVEVQAGEERSPEMRDLARALPDGARIAIVTSKSGERALELIRHDAAHVLATAVLELYEGVKISIGPPIAEGFYYDFEFPAGTSVSEADFERIEERMREHVKADEPFEREDVPVALARERFAREGQAYKVELIDRLALPQRPVHRSLPRAARAEHKDDRRVQAAVHRGRILAWRLQPHDAHARVWDGVLLARGAG
jgi:threonyl-tRNA synthetase